MKVVIDEKELVDYVTKVVTNLYRIDFNKDTNEEIIKKVLLRQGSMEVLPVVLRYLKDE